MRSAAIAALAASVVLGACGGRATSAGSATVSPSGASSTPAAGLPTTAPSTAEAPSPTMPTQTQTFDFTLTSPAFAEGGAIPREFTCDADDTSPPLEWTRLPEGSAALALIVDDPDAGGFVHWVAVDIDPGQGGLAAGASTAAGAPPQGRNSFGQTGYGGPCPPSGTHRYVFRLLALDQELGLAGTPDAASVLAAADGHILGEAQLTGTYKRGG
jgi:hypothetical protein